LEKKGELLHSSEDAKDGIDANSPRDSIPCLFASCFGSVKMTYEAGASKFLESP